METLPSPNPHSQYFPLSTSPSREGTCVLIDEPTLICDYHFNFVVYIKVRTWCYAFLAFDKCVVAYIHHYSIIQNAFTTLGICQVQSNHPSLRLNW